MNFPVWEVPFLGGGMLIGIVAVVHVLISHFAVGGGLFLALSERKAYRDGSPALLAYVKTHSRFFLLLSAVLGATTGVAIWFTIGLVHPAATSSLIHSFVWGWAIEWTFFLVEIAAIIVYVATWGTMDRAAHVAVGWIYAVTSVLTLAVINGIVSFMLTPGAWLASKGFWDGVFNPTYWPSLAARLLICAAFAGVYALLTASRLRDVAAKVTMVRYAARWVLPALAVLPAALFWYHGALPDTPREIVGGGIAAIETTARYGVIAALLALVLTAVGPLWRPRSFTTGQAALLLALTAVAMFSAERVREAIRKPYIIHGYMYAHAVRVDDMPALQEKGLLASARWLTARELTAENELRLGRELFRVQCASCHTVGGYQSIVPHLEGRTQEDLEVILSDLAAFRGYMPPFGGNDAERVALAKWLVTQQPPTSEGGR